MVASIATPFALLDKAMEIVRLDAFESSQMSVGLVSKVFDQVDVIPPVCEEIGLVDAPVMEIGIVKRIVCLEGVGVNNSVQNQSLLNNREQSLGSYVRNDSLKT